MLHLNATLFVSLFLFSFVFSAHQCPPREYWSEKTMLPYTCTDIFNSYAPLNPPGFMAGRISVVGKGYLDHHFWDWSSMNFHVYVCSVSFTDMDKVQGSNNGFHAAWHVPSYDHLNCSPAKIKVRVCCTNNAAPCKFTNTVFYFDYEPSYKKMRAELKVTELEVRHAQLTVNYQDSCPDYKTPVDIRCGNNILHKFYPSDTVFDFDLPQDSQIHCHLFTEENGYPQFNETISFHTKNTKTLPPVPKKLKTTAVTHHSVTLDWEKTPWYSIYKRFFQMNVTNSNGNAVDTQNIDSHPPITISDLDQNEEYTVLLEACTNEECSAATKLHFSTSDTHSSGDNGKSKIQPSVVTAVIVVLVMIFSRI